MQLGLAQIFIAIDNLKLQKWKKKKPPFKKLSQVKVIKAKLSDIMKEIVKLKLKNVYIYM